MSLRGLISKLESEGKILKVKREVSPDLEAANVLAALDGRAVMFNKVSGSDFPVIGNIVSSRDLAADALGVKKEQLLEKLIHALGNLKEPQVVESGPCQEVEEEPDLTKLPILKYMPKDGSKYIASAVCITKDPETGKRNACFHRLMLLDRNHLVARIVENRGTDSALKKKGELDIAICIGNSIPVLLVAATSLPSGVDEMAMANALEETNLVRCKTIDMEVPAETEFVLEGRITSQKSKEGPFLDLTETYDKVREQPIIEITRITRRKDAIFHALLPGKGEHKVLM